MKVYLKNMRTCDLNYQHLLLESEMPKYVQLTDDVSDADVVIFTGTCACTEMHINLALDEMSSILIRVNPNAKIYLTGCLSRNFIARNETIDRLNKWINSNVDEVIPQNNLALLFEKLFNSDIANQYADFGGLILRSDGIGADLYISNGCLNKCSFCKTSYQDYPLKSVDIDRLKKMIDYCDRNNIWRLCLLGTNISQYGFDICGEYLLPEIISYIEGKKNIESVDLIGFGFADAIHNNFAEIMRNSQKIELVNGSLESGSDRILKLIRKGFTSKEIIDFFNYINEVYPKNISLNIIAGFPTETIDDVKMTLNVLETLAPSFVGICRYIDSSFVESHNFEQLDDETIQRHARIYSKVLSRRKVEHVIVGK